MSINSRQEVINVNYLLSNLIIISIFNFSLIRLLYNYPLLSTKILIRKSLCDMVLSFFLLFVGFNYRINIYLFRTLYLSADCFSR